MHSLIKSAPGVALLICCLNLSALAQHDPVEGYWEGALVRGGAVRVVRVEFAREANALKAHFEIPDLINWGLRPQAVTASGGRLTFRVPLAGDATVEVNPQAGEMMGQIGNLNPPVTIHLRRRIRPSEIAIEREEVGFQNGEVRLAGTLVTPATAGPHPVIVWIHGRGGTLRADTAMIKMFAQRGIASLIYDKRGSGKSTGDLAKATMQDLAGDAQAAVEFLATRKDINARQIGLHGESAGGWIAPIVATHARVPVAFVITSAGPAESVRDQQIHVYTEVLRQSDIIYTEEEIRAADEFARLRMGAIFDKQGEQEYQAAVARMKNLRPGKRILLNDADDASDIDWMVRNNYDPAPDLKKITAPFLAFYGTRDYVVPPQYNTPKLEKYLTEAGNKEFKIVVIEGANHGIGFPDLVREVRSSGIDNYFWSWGQVAPGYAETMLDWLLKRVTVAR